jgi:hypothetical protein
MLKPYFSKKNIFVINTASIILLLLSILNINLLNRVGFVNSIYVSTPIYFWILISVNYLNGLLSVYFGDKDKIKSLINFGFIILLLTNIILLNLHIFENYTFLFLRGDSATYLGFIKDIILNGSFGNNFYPFLFSLIGIWSIISNYNYLFLVEIIPTLFYIIYFIFMYYWIKNISEKSRYIVYSMLLSLPLYFAWFSTSFYPEFLSILLLPMMQYLFVKGLKDTKFSYIILIIFVIIPLFHPITAVFFLIYSFIWVTYNYYFQKINKVTLIRIIYPTIFFFIVFSLWNINQLGMIRTLGELINNILLGFTKTTFNLSQYYVSSLGLLDSIKIILIMNIDEIILYLLSLVAIIYLLKRNYSKKLLLPILCLTIGTSIYLVLFITTRIHNVYRLINLDFNILFCIPIISFYLLSRQKEKYLNKKYLLLISFLFLTTTISLYQSPFTIYPYDYATKSELQGMNWLIVNNSNFIPTTSIASPTIRYSDYLFGENSNISLSLSDNWKPSPDHFNITRSDFNKNEVILFVTENDYVTYTTTWSFTGNFLNSDFIKMESNTDKIYDNNGLKANIIFIK